MTTPGEDKMPAILAVKANSLDLTLPKWKVLLVSVDGDLADQQPIPLDTFGFDDQPVLFLQAETADAAMDIFLLHPDIAVLMIDLSGDKKNDGLQLIRTIRRNLNKTTLRVLLLEDHSGYLKEWDILREYDISDYRDISTLTVPGLFTSLTIALQTFERLTSEEDSKQALQTILDITKELYGVRSVEEFCLTILSQLQIIKNTDDCFFSLPDENSGDLVIAAGKGIYQDATKRRIVEVVDATGFSAIQKATQNFENTFEEGMSILCISRDNTFKGVVFLSHETGPTLLEKRQMELICANIMLGLENADMFEEIKRLAFNDELTGLDSRAKFRNDVQDYITGFARPKKSRFVVVQFILDHLPELNIALGHEVGDDLLQFVSEQLTLVFPDAISIARTAGNGFGICVPYTRRQELRRIPGMIRQLFEHSPPDRENLPHITPRIGLAIYPEDADSATALWRDTNIALATVSASGSTYFCFYNNTIADNINARVEMNNALRQEIGRDNLSLKYQPQIDLENGDVVGVEALIRWQRDDGSFVAPDEFIPVAEASGLIMQINQWVLREACRQRKEWLHQGAAGFKVAVNLSLSTFQNDDLVGLIKKILKETQCPAELLELEVTESVIMENPEQTLQNFLELGKLGVGFSIDDFGTGYSSLSYLRQLPVSVLKIDKTFVDGMTTNEDDAAITRTIITLGRNLGLKVLAEGVETEEQAQFLRVAKCHQAQGYIFSRPIDAADVIPFMQGCFPRVLEE